LACLQAQADWSLPGERVVAFELMTVLACLTHWYTSAMFVVPVAAVGGWSWWSSRRSTGEDDKQGPPARA
jgi:hypothetical protein